MRGRWWSVVLALVLGCASPEQGAAQDGQPPAPAPTPAPAPAPRAGKDAKAPAVPYRARITDRFQKEPYELRRVVLFVPEVSLFGGGGGEEKRILVVKRGSAEIECPFERLEKVEVGSVDEEFLQVKVTLRAAGDAPAETLEGTVRSSVELRGTFGASQLATVVKLREVLTVELSPE